jgi:hypothetical protein
MSKRSIWLSYGLGLQGDYASLYQWLDARGAKECGDSMALVNVAYPDSLKDNLKEGLSRSINDELRPGLNDLATYNVKDFTDVCLRNKIEMLC